MMYSPISNYILFATQVQDDCSFNCFIQVLLKPWAINQTMPPLNLPRLFATVCVSELYLVFIRKYSNWCATQFNLSTGQTEVCQVNIFYKFGTNFIEYTLSLL